MKKVRKIFNILASLLIVLFLTGCAGIDAQLTSCLENISDMLNSAGSSPPPSDNEGSKEIESMELVFPEGRFLSTQDTATYKDCYVIIDDKWADSSYDINWKFNGELSDFKGQMYTFAPSSTAKSVTVEAVITYTTLTSEKDENGDFIEEITEYSAKEKVVYFEPFSAPTATFQTENGNNVYTISGFTDDDVIEWFVNGEKQNEGSQFSFAPTKAGSYDVSAKVNGQDANVQNSRVIKKGAQEITDVSIDIDSCFPNVLITFDADANANYIVRKTNGLDNTDYKDYTATTNSILIEYSDFFDGQSAYNVQVKTLDDEIYQGSVFSDAINISKPSNTAYSYLNKSYGYENAYISNDADFYEQFDYMMLSRTQPTTSETKISKDFYFSYSITGGINALVNKAFDACGYTGSYRLSSSGRNPYTVSIVFNTGNVAEIPSSTNTPESSNYSNNMNAYPLAISFTGRTDALPIDSKPQIEVSTTEQLYRLAELGYCPVPTDESVAQTVYNNARKVVSLITDEGMSDYEVALAVYDWVMYKNSYNNSVVSLQTQDAVKHPAFYLEGILYQDDYGFAVCDGISKTYSLLCNIAGVECIRVVGTAGQNDNWGGHAWNKVKIDGNWYVVDATWGDVTMQISYRTGGLIFGNTHTDTYEMGMHNYFLVTDDFIKDNHKEDSDIYPKTPALNYNHFANKKMSSNGVLVDMYVNETGTELKTKLDVIADAIVEDVQSKDRTQSFVVGDDTNKSNYFFYELGYSPLAKSNLISYMTSSSSFAIKLKNKNYGFSLFEIDGAVGIIVSYHYNSRLPSLSLTID